MRYDLLNVYIGEIWFREKTVVKYHLLVTAAIEQSQEQWISYNNKYDTIYLMLISVGNPFIHKTTHKV